MITVTSGSTEYAGPYGVPSVSKVQKVHALFYKSACTFTNSACTFTKSACTFTIVRALLQKVRALLQKVRALLQLCVHFS